MVIGDSYILVKIASEIKRVRAVNEKMRSINHNINFLFFSGVKIFEKVAVESILTDGKSITAVETNHGTIKCEILVNCGGQVNY